MGFYTRRLIRRLKDEKGLKIPDDIGICRCNPGWSTLSAGGFKWTFKSYDNPWWNDVGSQYTIRECAMAKQLFLNSNGWGDTFIDLFP